MKLRFILVFLLAAFSASAQLSLYVDGNQSTSGVGTTWPTAFKTFGEALIVANANTTSAYINIYVAKGTYYPTGVQNGTNRDSAFLLMRGGLWLFGGYPNGGGTRNIYGNPTILSGDIGTANDPSDNSYHVLVSAGILGFQIYTDTLILDGLTVTQGTANGTGTKSFNGYNFQRAHAGGMYVSSVWLTLLRNTRFVSNRSTYYGGGFYVGQSSTLKTDSATFTGNTADTAGGGIFSGAGAVVVGRSVFTGNTAGKGGAICHSNMISNLSMKTTLFSGNKATKWSGGAVDLPGIGTFLNSPWLFDSLTFTGNTAVTTGGAINSTAGWTTITQPTLRIRAGTFTGNTAGTGGGALSMDGIMNLVIDTCTFSTNKTATGNGGALWTGGPTPTTLNSDIFTNDSATASGGGAMYCSYNLTAKRCTYTNNYCSADGGGYKSNGTSDLQDCTFDGNIAGGGGGGIWLGTGNVKRCKIRGNKASGNGGGIKQAGFSTTMDNTLFSGNIGSIGGALVLESFASSTTLTNCTMAGNADQGGGAEAIFCNTSAVATLKNCIVWENAASGLWAFTSGGAAINATYTTVWGGYPGTGNSSANPLFVSPLPGSAAPTTGGNYSLSPCSPAIDAGQNTGSYTGVTDVAGNPRLDALVVDMGAYEVPQSLVAGTITGSASICAGSGQQLTTTVSGGTWSNPGPVLVSVNGTGYATAGTTAGTDTVIYTVVSGGCSSKAVKIFTVTALPVIAATSGSSTVCSNGTTQLTNTTAGGTWSSSNTSFATVNTTGLVTGVAAGTVTIFYKVTNTGGCSDSVGKALTVTTPPTVAAITGPATGVCDDATLQLADATAGGVWSDNCSGTILTVNSTGLVTGVDPGLCSAVYTVTDGNGCATSVNYPLTVYALPATPVITGPASTCPGAPVNYMATPAGGTWSTSVPALATISTTGTLTSIAPGSNTVKYIYTNINGCSAEGTLPITINAPVTKSVAATICPNGSYVFGPQTLTTAGTYTHTFTSAGGCDSIVTLTLTSVPLDTTVTVNGNVLKVAEANATSYQWLRCESNGTRTPLAGETHQTFTAPAAGNYAVFITRNSCMSMGNCHTIIPAAVADVTATGFALYPNPTTGKVTVKTGATIARRLTIHDITGKQLMSLEPKATETVLNLDGWAPGVYFVTITDAAGNSQRTRLSVVGR